MLLKLIVLSLLFVSNAWPVINFSTKNSRASLTGANGALNIGSPLVCSRGSFDIVSKTAISGGPVSQANGQVFLSDQLVVENHSSFNSNANTVFVPNGANFIADGWVGNYNLYCQSCSFFSKAGFAGTIVLEGANTIVDFYSASFSEAVFCLNTGTLRLGSNVKFSPGSRFYGPGTINLNGKSLSLNWATLVGPITISGGGPIFLSGTNVCHGTLTIDTPVGQTTTISGGVLDFVQNGSSGLNFTGLGSPKINHCNLLGVGASNLLGGTITSVQELVLSGVLLDMSQTFTQTSVIRFNGESSTIADNGTNTWYVANTLTIDTTTIFYSRTEQTSTSPLVTTGAGSIVSVGTGRQAPVQAMTGSNGLPGAAGRDGDWFAGNKTISATNVLGGDPRQLKASSRLTFSGTPNTIYDAGGAWFTGPNATSNNIALGNGVTLIFKNINLDGVFESNYSFGTTTAVIFGDNTRLIMDKDQILTGASRAWTFSGNCILDGAFHDLDLQGAGNIVVKTGSTLTCKNLNFSSTVNNAITMESPTSTLVFKDSKISMPAVGFVFSKGNLMFSGDSIITTKGNFTGVDNNVTFSFSSGGQLTLADNSTLTFAPGVIFNFRPYINFRQPFSSANGFVFSGPSSKLILDGATLQVTYSGLLLTNGTLVCQRASNISMDLGLDNELIITNNFDIEFESDARLTTKGSVNVL